MTPDSVFDTTTALAEDAKADVLKNDLCLALGRARESARVAELDLRLAAKAANAAGDIALLYLLTSYVPSAFTAAELLTKLTICTHYGIPAQPEEPTDIQPLVDFAKREGL